MISSPRCSSTPSVRSWVDPNIRGPDLRFHEIRIGAPMKRSHQWTPYRTILRALTRAGRARSPSQMTHGVLASFLAPSAAALTRTHAMDVNAYLPVTKLGILHAMVAFALRYGDDSRNIGDIWTTYCDRRMYAALWPDAYL